MKHNIRVNCDANTLYVGDHVVLSWSTDLLDELHSLYAIDILNELSSIVREDINSLLGLSEQELDEVVSIFLEQIQQCPTTQFGKAA